MIQSKCKLKGKSRPRKGGAWKGRGRMTRKVAGQQAVRKSPTQMSGEDPRQKGPRNHPGPSGSHHDWRGVSRGRE